MPIVWVSRISSGQRACRRKSAQLQRDYVVGKAKCERSRSVMFSLALIPTAFRAGARLQRVMTVLGLDIGTTGCKVVAVSGTGAIIGRGHREYALRSPREGWAELDADEVWSSISSACRDATYGTEEPVNAVSIAAAAEVALPVAASGKVLGPAIVSIDPRTVDEYHSVLEKMGAARLTQLGGFEPRPHHTLFRWLWIPRSRAHGLRTSSMAGGLDGLRLYSP